MGFFSRDTEADARKKIETINREMREISASMHLNYNMIDGRNRDKIRRHYNNIVSYSNDYERIKSNIPTAELLSLLSATVDVWNGERVDVLTWEQYLFNVMWQLKQDINY